MKRDRKNGHLSFFGKYDLRDEKQLVRLGKWAIFITLILLEALIILNHLTAFAKSDGWKMLFTILIVEGAVTLMETFKLFVLPEGKVRTSLYILDALSAFGFTFITTPTYATIVYMLILTSFYFDIKRLRPAVVLFAFTEAIYIACKMVQSYVLTETASLLGVLTSTFGTTFALFLHFIVVEVALHFYRQYIKLDTALRELDESKRALEKAYAVVAEVTALEERQRIAKDIHDTAGHSLTTVIMQTEVAKRIIDKSPAEAKQKIISANLQAKHALEELRDSVHLLSGNTESKTLKTALEDIIHESTDGTGIVIRSNIEDVTVSPAKARFLCNSLKEGIANGLRHGGATAFWFELVKEDNLLQFVLSDNGKGVELGTWTLGFGLTGMQNRARALGGEVAFASETDEGLEIRITVPADGKEWE